MAYVQGRFEELVASEPGGLADLPASVLLELLQSEALAMSSELTALKACGPTHVCFGFGFRVLNSEI